MPDDICPTEHDEPVVLTDEEGNEHQFTVEGVFEVNGKEYAALIPVHDEEEAPEVVIMRVDQEDGRDVLVEIEDDEEFDIAADAYEEILDSEEEAEADPEEGEIQ